MKIAIKNFITTLKRFKVASLLNIAGLALAFAAFYIIMAQVYSSFTFNSSIKDNERVYMLSPYYEFFGGWGENVPNPVSYETAEALPAVEAIASLKISDHAVWADGDGEAKKYDYFVSCCNAPILDVFSFKLLVGSADDFKRMNSAVVSESAAKVMGVNVGDVIYTETGSLKPETQLTVVGIFEDFAANTILGGRHIFRNDNREQGMDNSNWNYSVFVKLHEGADPKEYVELWSKKFLEFNEKRLAEYVAVTGEELNMTEEERAERFNMPVKLIPMDDFYFTTEFEMYPNGSWGTTMTLLAIALVIVVVAFINFVNFFMALVPVRIRTVNICKVFGAGQGTLRMNFFFEAVGLVLIALAIALYIVSFLDGGFINEYISCPLSIGENIATLAVVLAIAVGIAVVAAVYPAFYITGFNASLAVKGGFASSKAGRVLRSGLVSLQFIVSMVLMVLALVFSLQYSHMIRYNVGIERENILEVNCYDLSAKEGLFIEELEKIPGIAAVTSSVNPLFGNSHSCQVRTIDDVDVEMSIWFVRYNFTDVFGIPVIAGEGITKERNGYLITDYTAEATGLGVGDKWSGMDIIGIIPHINLMGANSPNGNTLLLGNHNYVNGTYYVRLNQNVDVEAVCNDIRQAARNIEPNSSEPKIEFVNDAIAKVYGDTKKQTVMISLFALIAVVISLMGVFGIVLFETQHRRSEIAVRKVYGASSGSVVAMFNRRYLFIVVVCFAVAAPVAWIIASNWLQGFINRIELSLWLPLAVFTVVMLLTALLVTLRSWKAATENPADVVRSN